MNIYVGNIAYIVTDDDLKKLFEKFGSVTKVKLMTEYDMGENAGWGFVTMENDEDANKAITALNLKNFRGKKIKVNQYRRKKNDGPKFGEWRNY